MATQQLEIRDHRDKDWFWANNGVIDWYGGIIGADSIAVYMTLAKYANTRGESWPSYKTIGVLLNLSRPTVIKCMKKLEAAELVAKTGRTQPTKEGGTMPDSNVYVLLNVKPLDEPSKARLLGVVNQVDQRPSKPGLPHLVNDVDHPSKRRLPKQDSWNKTQLNKTQRERAHTPAITAYFAAFPELTLSKKQIERITATVGEGVERLKCWQETIGDYEMSTHWKPENLSNMLERFERKLAERAKGNTNGTHPSKRSQTGVDPDLHRRRLHAALDSIPDDA